MITGTPADILILDAAVGTLAAGETRELVLWDCGPDVDCAAAAPEPLTVTGRGTVLIHGHRIYESAHAYQVRPRDGAAGRSIDYWMAPPGLFSGGPVRIDFDAQRGWRRVR